MGYVYLLHFDKPLCHAQHYIGWSKYHPEKKNGRIHHHRTGNGSRLTKAIKNLNIGFTVAKIWGNADHKFEYDLKKKKCARLFCPICIKLKKKL